MRVHQQLLDMMNLAAIDKMAPEEFRREIGEMVRELLAAEQVPLSTKEKSRLVGDILDELLGLGPLEPLLKDHTVSDILVNTHRQVFVERAGQLASTAVRFKDDRHLLRIINKIVADVGRRVDESQPLVDARLPDGSRVNAVIPPIAVDGPLLSIRKFAKMPFSMQRLVDVGALSPEMANILEAIVRGRLNALISGGTGSGKTTMLNAMSRAIDQRERIVTIEDAAELQLQQPHVARLETRPANVEGRGEITQRDLVKNALRMRPDRIILGEVRAGEAFDMLQAMNTGHDGSMSTIHANTCRDALSRLEQMIGMAGIDMSTRSIRGQIASAINVVLQLERASDGKRRLISIHEVTGMEGDIITMNEIFRFQRKSTDADGTVHGHYWATGIRPRFFADLQAKGVQLPPNLFSPDKPLG
ncbi:MAG: CpaF family protein [Rhodospirillales bacterium]|nr:CpaF family protein [Rhodospirillales bacterium]